MLHQSYGLLAHAYENEPDFWCNELYKFGSLVESEVAGSD